MSVNSKETRTREGLYWEMEHGYMNSAGFTPDHGRIATKPLSEAANRAEYIFIGLREILEQNESYCLDDETERLTLCENISSWVKQNLRHIEAL